MSRKAGSFAALAVALLLVPAIAGCVGSGSGPGSDAAPADRSDRTSEKDRDRSKRKATAGETGAGRKATEWVEDHWGDEEELVVVDGTDQVWTGPSAAQDGQTGACATPCEAAYFRPADGALIPPGTERLNVTVSWSEPPGLQIDLFYEPATGEDVPPFNDVPNGEPFSVPVEGSWHDAPFQTASLWWFNLWPSADPGGAVPPTDVSLRVVAERNATLTEIPPAPDRKASDEARLVDGETVQLRLGVHPTPGCIGLFVSCHPPDPGAWWMSRTGSRVPEDATTVRATLEWSQPLPVPPELDAIHPGGRVRMEVVEDDPSTMERTFETSVPAEGVDSPWQPRSLWRFSPVFETEGQEAGVSRGSFTLTAVALTGNGTEGA